MKVRELIQQLIDMPMDANVELEVQTWFGFEYSKGDANSVTQLSDNRVLIEGE